MQRPAATFFFFWFYFIYNEERFAPGL